MREVHFILTEMVNTGAVIDLFNPSPKSPILSYPSGTRRELSMEFLNKLINEGFIAMYSCTQNSTTFLITDKGRDEIKKAAR